MRIIGAKSRGLTGLTSTMLAASVLYGTFLIAAAPASAGTDTYPAKWSGIRMDSVFDSWGEYNRECTSYVAWMLASVNGFNMPFYANAGDWKAKAKALGYTVNSTPAVGAVAWSPSHVAWVESVNASSGKLTLEEYNELDSNRNGTYGDDGTYDERTAATSAYQYIHFKDIGSTSPPGNNSPPSTSYPRPIQAQFVGSGLATGQWLVAGQGLLSPNAQFALVMQGDGNLVLYSGGQPLWNSGTPGSGAAFFVVQGDGNAVLYRANGTPVWNSRTAGRGPSTAQIQDDGNFVVYTQAWAPTWSSTTAGHHAFSYVYADRLYVNQALYPDDYIRSADGRNVALLDDSGNLVVYGPGYGVRWMSNTGGHPSDHLVIQGDGNLVLYTINNVPLWNSRTAGQGASSLVIQGDGNLVTYRADDTPTWSVYTGTIR